MKLIKRSVLPVILATLVIGLTACAHPPGGHGGHGGGNAAAGHK